MTSCTHRFTNVRLLAISGVVIVLTGAHTPVWGLSSYRSSSIPHAISVVPETRQFDRRTLRITFGQGEVSAPQVPDAEDTLLTPAASPAQMARPDRLFDQSPAIIALTPTLSLTPDAPGSEAVVRRPPMVTPEPASWLLVTLGLLGLAGACRRRRRYIQEHRRRAGDRGQHGCWRSTASIKGI